MPTGGGSHQPFDQRLLNAAARLIREEGYEGLAPATAAERAGVTLEGDPPGQWDLFDAVVRGDEDRFNALVASALAASETHGERLLAVIETCVLDYDWTYWIELWSLALRDDRARALRAELDGAFRSQLAQVVEAGRASGEFDAADAELAAVAIATLIDALAVEATLGDDTVSPNYMLGACASVAGRILGTELRLRDRSDYG